MITVQRIIAFRDSHPTWDFISQLWNLRSHLSTKIHLTTGGLNQICWAPPICIQHHLEIDMQYMLLCIHNSFNYQKVQILWSTINFVPKDCDLSGASTQKKCPKKKKEKNKRTNRDYNSHNFVCLDKDGQTMLTDVEKWRFCSTTPHPTFIFDCQLLAHGPYNLH